jgi:hypothetical protein
MSSGSTHWSTGTLLGAEWRDLVVIFGGCILAFILSASLGLIDSIHDYLDDLEQFQADEVLTALMMAAGLFSSPPAGCLDRAKRVLMGRDAA